jgi:hypothetical protein
MPAEAGEQHGDEPDGELADVEAQEDGLVLCFWNGRRNHSSGFLLASRLTGLDKPASLHQGTVVSASYPLAHVKQLAHAARARLGNRSSGSGSDNVTRFSAEHRLPEPMFNHKYTTDVISDRLDISLSEAKTFIYDVLSTLTDGDYWKTSPTPPPPADIYGTTARRIDWYIKLKILHTDRLNMCSFHPPVQKFNTTCGNAIG